MSSEYYKPVIVVVAYNRLNSLKRLLGALKKGYYHENTRLIISIDHSSDNSAIVDCAKEFIWDFGEKEIILHPENIGLRKHIISCGDLSFKYGSVIILEDDLFVSPWFFEYSTQALNFYKDHGNISGIGLFNYPHIENSVDPEPFIPIIDNSDVFFIQYACSSGQAWTVTQWKVFRNWYDTSPDVKIIEGLPEHILSWPERSWKKYFNGYLILHNKFFVYPRVALSSNFDDIGSNRGMSTFELQSSLLIERKDFKFKMLQDSISVYDANFEILPEKLKSINSKLSSYNFAVDLYGYKNPEKIEEEYLLTIKNCNEYQFSFARSLKPHEMNVIMDLNGSEIFLCRKNSLVKPGNKEKIIRFVSNFNYHYRTTLTIREMSFIFWFRMQNKFMKLKKRIL